MDEPARILALMQELESDVAYARGERGFSGEISRGDSTLIAGKLLEAIDEGTDARARKAEQAGLRIACTAGCHHCCEQPILVWLPEALVVAEFLHQPENAAAKQGFLDRYPAWRDAVGDRLERLADRSEAKDWDGYAHAQREAWARRVVCAFNRDGLCSIYAARPVVCRHYHALDTAEHCRVDDDSGIAPRFLTFKPLDDFVGRSKRLDSAMHHALGGRRMRMVALCTAVFEILGGR